MFFQRKRVFRIEPILLASFDLLPQFLEVLPSASIVFLFFVEHYFTFNE